MGNSIKSLNSIKLSFDFEEQDELNDLNFNVNFKTNKQSKHIKILNTKKKRKNINASTKLF